jgi:hypothetical protein
MTECNPHTHQHIGVNSQPKPLPQLAQQLQEMETVRVVAEDGLAFVASGHDVKAPAVPLNAQSQETGSQVTRVR